MLLSEKIQLHVRELPEPLQAEVLDFVEYLLTKVAREAPGQEDADWARQSLELAMRGMETEDSPVYTASDLKVTFTS